MSEVIPEMERNSSSYIALGNALHFAEIAKNHKNRGNNQAISVSQ
jgi:hypothetical protein